jgi:hypothetical protein
VREQLVRENQPDVLALMSGRADAVIKSVDLPALSYAAALERRLPFGPGTEVSVDQTTPGTPRGSRRVPIPAPQQLPSGRRGARQPSSLKAK